ncbi:MAG: methyl-accepting chemotaxis protein [Kofleriaceae bacterium]
MTIKSKISLGFAIPIALLVAIGILTRVVSARQTTTTEWVEHTLVVQFTMQEVLGRLIDAESAGRGYFITGEVAFLEPFATAQTDVSRALDRAIELTRDNRPQQVRIEQVRELTTQRLAAMAASIEVRRQGPFDIEQGRVRLAEGKLAMDRVRHEIKGVTDTESSLLATRRAEAESATDIARNAVNIALVLGVLAGILAAVLIARSIVLPIGRLRDGVERVSSGDLEHRIAITAQDESGQLAAAFNKMVDRRKTAEQTSAALSTQRERTLVKVGEIASQLATSAEELFSTTSSQASGAQEQSAAVAETTAIVEEVVQTSAQAAERAQQVSDLARDAAEVGATGHDALEKATTTMESARQHANRVAKSILSLAEQAQSIGDIIATVDDIAEQSNLLALNAALEAAHAGDHGRGFVIVATEMKSLAEQSKSATVQIRRMLGAIQKQSNDAVLMTEASTRGIGEASSAAESVGVSLRTLAEAVSSAAQAIAQIAASARQQSGGLQQINQAMRDVAGVANQNLATTRQVGQAARDLTALGATLRDAFGRPADERS